MTQHLDALRHVADASPDARCGSALRSRLELAHKAGLIRRDGDVLYGALTEAGVPALRAAEEATLGDCPWCTGILDIDEVECAAPYGGMPVMWAGTAVRCGLCEMQGPVATSCNDEGLRDMAPNGEAGEIVRAARAWRAVFPADARRARELGAGQ